MSKELDEYLNDKTGGVFDFKLKSAKLSKTAGLCFVEMFYKDGMILSPEKRKECEEILKEVMPAGFSYSFKFIKNFLTKEALCAKVKEYFAKNHPAITYEIVDVNCENKSVCVTFEERQEDYVRAKKIVENLKAFLKESFFDDFTVETKKIETKEVSDLPFESMVVEDTPLVANRTIEVSNEECVVGDLKDNLAFYIKDKKTPGEEVVFCGNLEFIREHSYTPKKKPKDDQKEDKKQEAEEKKEESKPAENGETAQPQEGENSEKAEEENKNERKFFKFSLKDFSGNVSCVFFANKNNYEPMTTLVQGEPLIVSGRLEEDKFSGGVSLRVKNISRCTLPEKFEEEIVWKSEPKEYRYVFPEPLVYYSQTDLFSMGEEKPVHEYFKGKEIVVFDLETTGLNVAEGEKIIEIGAVKMVDGKFTDKFMCMVDPQMKIPEKIVSLTGIRDEDVAGAHTYDEVLADFYKFTRGCILSGYNVKFDYGFLSYYGKKCGYNFDNPLLDVYELAQKGVHGTKNLKLGTVAEKLGVVLDNAHRAVYDALAAAEVLQKLADFA